MDRLRISCSRRTGIVLGAALFLACGHAPPPPRSPDRNGGETQSNALQGDASSVGNGPFAPDRGGSLAKTPGAGPLAIVAASDRTADDRKLDGGRKPAELLAFAGIGPGMRVGELVAGGGYTTELLARAVGPKGIVYAENPSFILEKFAAKPWADRLAKDVTRNVVRLDRELEDPFPADVRQLDAVLMVLFYHDTYWMKTDRHRMNQAVFAALKPGGVYIVIDHSGRPGTGSSEAASLHRVEESLVRSEVAKAGFQLQEEGTFLRNPGDSRDWNASPSGAGERRGSTDRFVLKFVKPGVPQGS